MIRGIVNARFEAIVPLTVRGPHGTTVTLDASVDSGFNGTLSLPPSVIAELELDFVMEANRRLADGLPHQFQFYRVEVQWGDVWKRVLVLEADGPPLVGMVLMEDYELRIEVRPGGAVLISKIGH